MDEVLKSHGKELDRHEDDLCEIRRDLVDIKTRLGIKDMHNGQVVEYQKMLADSLALEREERKATDEKLDSRTWYILTGVILSVLLEIGFMLFKV